VVWVPYRSVLGETRLPSCWNAQVLESPFLLRAVLPAVPCMLMWFFLLMLIITFFFRREALSDERIQWPWLIGLFEQAIMSSEYVLETKI
jgi:hypothetical protein